MPPPADPERLLAAQLAAARGLPAVWAASRERLGRTRATIRELIRAVTTSRRHAVTPVDQAGLADLVRDSRRLLQAAQDGEALVGALVETLDAGLAALRAGDAAALETLAGQALGQKTELERKSTALTRASGGLSGRLAVYAERYRLPGWSMQRFTLVGGVDVPESETRH